MSSDTIPAALNGKVTVEVDCLPMWNLALHQNAMPVIFSLRVKNGTDRELRDVACRITSTPGMMEEAVVVMESVPAGGETAVHNPKATLDYAFLASLSDRVAGALRVEARDAAGEILATCSREVEAFAADQWLGLRVCPELVASFVTPNLEVIALLMGDAARELEKRTGSAALDGYQSGSKQRAYEMCKAVYAAVCGWGITYANPAASFGAPGQRIRFADAIYKHRLGTCLDLALLFASTLEQCGLHPVILFHEGHAYAGCHLRDTYFPEAPMEDLQAIRKLAELDEFVVFETTMVTQGEPFSTAEATARNHHLSNDTFRCAVDVVRARLSGIRPLPLKRGTDGLEFDAPRAGTTPNDKQRRDLCEEITVPGGASAKNRVTRWQQKLLDLSLRNRLLNVRDTKQVIPVSCPDIAVLEDKIAANESVSLDALGNLLGEADQRKITEQLRDPVSRDALYQLLATELGKHRLWSPLATTELSRRLTAIYRQNKTDIDEGGVNTLFLALGLLEGRRDNRTFLAPIVLIPVRLTRASVQSGFSITRIDEEVFANVTLLEMLRREFELSIAGVDPLPQDETGVDIHRVMQIFRQAVKPMPGWEIYDEARLGLFSFNKFIMWNDLTNRMDALRQHPVIAHLIDGGGMFDDGVDTAGLSASGQLADVRNVLCPVNADASQLTAVLYSAAGKSFVLHGPPGTGKSQTITNLIAHNLAQGRRVLFVSEKRAALDVVHKRLSAVGLGPFCLELHSNKASKADVLRQFAEALSVADAAPPPEWDTATAQWRAHHDELNAYAEALHAAHPNGLSAHHCLSHVIHSPDEPFADLANIDFMTQTRDALTALENCAAALADAMANVPAATRAAFAFIKPVEWSPALQETLAVDAQRALDALAAAQPALAETAACHGLDTMPATRDNLRRMTALCDAFAAAGSQFPAALSSPDLPIVSVTLREGIATGRVLDALAEKLNAFHLDRVAELDCSGIAKRMADRLERFVLTRWLLGRALIKELAGIKKTGAPRLTLSELSEKLPVFREYGETRRRHDTQRPILEARFNAPLADWDALDALFVRAENIHAALTACGAPATAFTRLVDNLANPSARDTSARFTAVAATLEQTLHDFDDAHGLPATDDLDALRRSLRELLAHLHDTRRALIWKQHRETARAAGLANWVDALDRGAIPLDKSATSLALSVRRAMAHQILAANKTLRDFMGGRHDACVAKFREWDARCMEFSRRVIISRLAGRCPPARHGKIVENTEMGLLKRECQKRARQKPVRELLAKIPTLLPALKPCFLMSPLSVAQYLPAELPAFDLLVFDEASQIPVWDAIGAIARARQLIVVGDPKQMPPTNFFQRGENDEPDTAEDLESILDECLAAGLHSTHLNWHYRSRHESLIAFSNHHYYDDRLHTFPAAANAPHLGVRLHFVENGVYDRTQTRTNNAEAAAVVAHVLQRLANPATRGKSIGIVTFSLQQKNLIEDLLEQEAARQPDIEAFLNDQRDEPLFVKNLENVQGDERDVILFSVGYAPDKDGRFYMNFGPLNRQGGERRLNVAITRAKEQVLVFTSIHAHQIDLARTPATGAHHLRYFLEYTASNGTHAAAANAAVAEPFPATVADFLARHNYTVHPRVGQSACRLDLAVLHPDKPGENLLAIECDGPNYIATPSVRDRDRNRHAILTTLGWTMRRLWSADWYHDRAQAEQTLLDTLAAARAVKPATEPAFTATVISIQPARKDTPSNPHPH